MLQSKIESERKKESNVASEKLRILNAVPFGFLSR